MRIDCPHCGERGSAEFSYLGAADPKRPAANASAEAWHDYVYLRENPAGPLRELWQHVHGCRQWLVVTRDTRNHLVLGVEVCRGRAV
ncbi:MAG: Sarcosine oxidase delta subunit heterotetrameric [Rubritepida sp.]|nr:Sarcosine oxidase delta subunit heterotetrameric [Rubritepida sp.]